jgi:excisionase family DNA binding protein
MIKGEERYLTVEQAADVLGLKVVTIRSWIGRRTIGHVRLGKRAIRVPESEIQKLLERGFVSAVPERLR